MHMDADLALKLLWLLPCLQMENNAEYVGYGEWKSMQ